jgi:glucosamine--fructose-6-phosphate aminotransferase (isomerizing)
MCGIVGYVGSGQAQRVILAGLARLEYRGYDSAGLAVLGEGGIAIRRRVGKLKRLRDALKEELPGNLGIGHTRWATHGLPSEENAHPHLDCSGRIALVHNGIIENHRPLRERLAAQGHLFRSQTDSEVLAHLVEAHYRGNLVRAVAASLGEVRGALAIAVIHADHPEEIVVARLGSPLVVGLRDGEGFVASDVPALLPYTRKFLFLEDGEVARVRPGAVEVWDPQGRPKAAAFQHVPWDPLTAEKQGYRHFMEKEIHEQPQTVADTLLGAREAPVDLWGDLGEIRHVFFIACGTSYHAALAAAYLWEPLLGIPVRAEIASEFRYRAPAVGPDTLVVAVSQSGETVDTQWAVRGARAQGAKVLALANVVGSTIPRESDLALYTRAGLEVGVAATKTFTAQLAALASLGLGLAHARGNISQEELEHGFDELALAPTLLARTLETEGAVLELAQRHYQKRDFLYLARGILYPLALEGALKLKEISYIHAEGYPAGEMKHGPIALIDEEMPVVFLISGAELWDKTLSNMEEVRARRGILIAFSDQDAPELRRLSDHLILLPAAPRWLLPLVFAPPLQLLAYHIARLRGTDVDQPRNLAKTVTVE